MRVCVIGAGIAGLCSAKYSLEYGLDVTVYEQINSVGGTWVYTDYTGKGDYNLDVHSSMYEGLRTNLPKEIMGYPDFPIPCQEKSYIPAKDVLEFLKLYANNFGLYEKIKFEHQVIRVTPYKDTQWEVIVKDLANNKIFVEHFDSIIVCNGHYSKPSYPNLIGIENFKGKSLHSHDYRKADKLKNERVLVIGAGPSGVDIALEATKFAEHVTISHHKKETIDLPGVIQKPDVDRIKENGVVLFTDGTENTFTFILYCTGYKYKFPFLSVDCEIACDNNYVRPLYKHCININRPTMAFIGLPFYVCATQAFDLQTRFALKFLSGSKKLPSKEEMMEDTKRDMDERWNKGYRMKHAHMMGKEQGRYYKEISEIAEIEPIKPVMMKIYQESISNLYTKFGTFRNNCYKIIDDENYIKIS